MEVEVEVKNGVTYWEWHDPGKEKDSRLGSITLAQGANALAFDGDKHIGDCCAMTYSNVAGGYFIAQAASFLKSGGEPSGGQRASSCSRKCTN